MQTIRERIENNIVIWMLATLLTGFLAGIGTYEGALRIMELKVVSRHEIPTPINSETQLPDHIRSSDIELMFTRVKAAYNDGNNDALYNLLGPIGRAQVNRQYASENLKFLHDNLGEIKDGFFVQHQFLGQNGLYKSYSLNFSVEYEMAPKGLVTLTLIDDGKSYQLNGIFFNRL